MCGHCCQRKHFCCPLDSGLLWERNLVHVLGPQGGHSPQFTMGVCRRVPGNMNLFQTKEKQLCYPVPDKMVKMDTLFQTEKCETWLTFDSEMACLSKHALGLEREKQQLSFAALFWQQNSHPDRAPELHGKK